MIIGALEIQMAADLTRLRQEMAQAKSVVGDAAKSMQSAVSAVGSAFQSLGAGVSVGAVVAWAKHAIDVGDAMQEMAQKVGMSVEDVSALGAAFAQNGVDAEAMKSGLVKMAKSVTDSAEVWKALGISVSDASGNMRPSKELMVEVSDLFAQMPDGIIKTRLATELFGKAGADLIPTLNAGSKGLMAMMDEAKRLGLVISDEAARAADDFGDSLTMLKKQSEATTLNFVSGFLPAMTETVKQLMEARKSSGQFGDAFNAAMVFVGKTALEAITLVKQIGNSIGGLAAALVVLFTDGFGAASAVFGEMKAKNLEMAAELKKGQKAIEDAKAKSDERNEALKRGAELAAYSAGEERRLAGYVDKSALALANAAIRAKELAAQREKAAAAAKKLADAENERLSKRGLWELRRQDEAEAEAEKAAQKAIQADKDLMSARGIAAMRRNDEAEADAERVAQEYIKAMAKADEQVLADWQRTVDQMGQSLADALMQGGKNIAGYLQGLFRTLVLRPVLMPAATAMASFISGPAGAATGGGASGAGGLLNIGGALGSIGGFGSAAGAGFSATLGGAGLGDLLAGAGAALGQGTMAGATAGLGMGIGAIAPYAIAAVAAYALGKKLFGRKLADTGVEGSFDASGDFAGSAYSFYKGGLFRKDKTRRSTLDPALDATLDAGATAMAATVKQYAEVLGLPVDAIKGYSQQIKLSLKGLSEEQIKAKIEEAIAGFGEGLAGRFAPALQVFQKAGESLADTLARLSGLQTFSNTLADLGGVFARVAGLSVDAREAFIAMAGGMDTLSKNAMQFVQDYYNRDEIAGIKAAEIKDALAAVGITRDVNSRDEFRALVDSINVGTEAGQQQLAALLDMAQGFTQVADYLTETGATLSGAAAQSPGGNATALFAAGGAADQLAAINNVGFWSERIFGAIKEQTAALVSGTPAAAAVSPKPEVNGGMPASNWQWGPDGAYYGV